MPGWAADHSFRRAQKNPPIEEAKIKEGNHLLDNSSVCVCVRVCDYILTIYGETAISSAVLRTALFIRLRLAKEAQCSMSGPQTHGIVDNSTRFRADYCYYFFSKSKKKKTKNFLISLRSLTTISLFRSLSLSLFHRKILIKTFVF